MLEYLQYKLRVLLDVPFLDRVYFPSERMSAGEFSQIKLNMLFHLFQLDFIWDVLRRQNERQIMVENDIVDQI